ncbi:hypothetical protein Asphe3_39500 [Pseudarthrobacter phenanthrenivorans Sphe3]|uniref:Uncharacterized protein n=1 Tax=Pseudarthrobacter phenanthrenivorans (strain DSM 18606 / JCM 16027 / LMG 23796 / Sphe3) TaxID=930171 RepID=F0MA51_PSEPM|nr:hypothetical protein [Pseudarthrobacter phenanthrenivorans]ADX75038.1 hypothetical protein Asphe3_39500 [Pseudarthrobacter phenanthrenivorans Sphe3]
MPTNAHRVAVSNRSAVRAFALTAVMGLTLSAALTSCDELAVGSEGPAGSSISSIRNLPKVPWEGGPAYWNRFPKAAAAGWNDPSFFPISVFMGKPEHAPQLKALGINTYMGAEHDGSPLSEVTGSGLFVLPQDEWSTAEVGQDPRAVGWFVSDECDIGLGCSGLDAAANLLDQQQKVDRIRGLKDGRFTMANYSNGVLDTYWAQGSMAELMKVVDVASVDKYAYTSPFVDDQLAHSPHWPNGAEPATSGAYGWLVDRMRSYQDPVGAHPNWIFIEAARPLLLEDGSLTISLEQMEGAAWSAIIHEARGLAYFQHNNGTTCGFYSLVECDADRLKGIRAINAGIQALAPVLNTQSYQYSFNTTTDTMLKEFEGSAYIFAGIGLTHSPGQKTFTLPAGVTASAVEVVGENRTLDVADGAFTDNFEAEYSHHTYKFSL